MMLGDKIYLGSSEVNKAYLGAELVYNSEPYDSKVEYLASDSTAYINTGVAGGNKSLEITIDFMFTKWVNYGGIYGNYVGDTYNAVRLILNNSSNVIVACLDTQCSNAGNTTGSCAINTRHTVVSSYNSLQIDSNTAISTKKGNGNNNTNNICLFNRSLTNAITRDIGLRIYSLQIRDDGVLIRDFIPVRVGEVGYMYDQVNRLLYENVGSGNFSIGADK